MVSILKIMTLEERLIYAGIVLVLFAFALFILSTPTEAALSIQKSGTTSGFTTSNMDAQWVDGDRITQVWPVEGPYNEGASAQQLVAGPGSTAIDISAELKSDYSRQTTVSTKKAQFAVWDSLATRNIIPNESEVACTAGELAYAGTGTSSGSTPLDQQAYGQTGATGSGKYGSAQYNDGSTFAQSAKFEGNGSLYGDLTAGAKSGSDKDDDDQDYENWIQDHQLWAGDKTAALIDWTWDDFSDTFNLTNETVADEGGNSTPEEAES